MTLSRKAKDAIKVALAMAIAYGISLSMDWDRPYWAGFAVAFVSLASIGQSLNKAALRMYGTLLAVAVSLTLIALFAQERWAFILFLSACTGFCAYMMSGSRHQYFWQACGFIKIQPSKVEIDCIGKPLLIAEASAANLDHPYPAVEAFCRTIAHFQNNRIQYYPPQVVYGELIVKPLREAGGVIGSESAKESI